MSGRALPIPPIPDKVMLTEDLLPNVGSLKFTAEIMANDSTFSFSLDEEFQPALVTRTKLLTSVKAVKPVYSLTLSLPNHRFHPGDSFDIICENSTERVLRLLGRLGLSPDDAVSITGEYLLKPGIYNLFSLFKKCLDFNQYPKKVFLRHLAEFTRDPHEQQTLYYLSSRLGSSAYLSLAKEYANLEDYLITFPSCRPSLQCVLQYLPPLAPRAYSVCSFDPHQVEFICSIDSYQTPSTPPQVRLGICSSFLQEMLLSQQTFTLYLKPRPPTSMVFPPIYHPMIMICAGAGLSPFLGFLRYAKAQGIKMVDSWLFYGFRSRQDDCLYGGELEELEKEGILPHVLYAMSRDEQRYVQHVLWDNREAIGHLMTTEPKARIYLCGDEMTMIRAVNECLEKINPAWTKEKRIIRDIWV